MTAEELMSSSVPQKALEKDIENAITGILERKENENEQFACEHKLKTVWNENQHLEKLLEGHLSPEQIDFVRGNLIKVLSTLIWIDWHRWSEFQRIFLDHCNSEGRRDRLDDSLPIEDREQLADSSFLADSASARHFLVGQHVFLPIPIEEHEDQICSKTRRLPFIRESGEIRGGSYGQVSKEVVACRYFIHKQLNSPPCPSQAEVTIARKRLPIEKEFREELKNLDVLRESLLKNPRIMTHLGTLVHGNTFNIFFPWADMDLRGFIYEEWENHQDRKRPIYLIEEASNLAGALAFLHSDIKIPGGRKVSCVHMDLKPENIVVRFDGKSPAGAWMITDFGISAIKKTSSDDQSGPAAAPKRLSALNSVGDVAASLTRTEPRRQPGPFQAPEVQDTNSRSVGTKSDIWSLGCVLCLVLALGEGPGMVKSFDKERSRDEDPNLSTDYFYREIDPLSASRARVKWEVKHHVLDWLDARANGCSVQRDWIRDYVSLLKTMIVIGMDLRPDAKKVHAGLVTILEKAKAAEGSPRSNGSPYHLPNESASPTSAVEAFEFRDPTTPAPSAFRNESSQGSTSLPGSIKEPSPSKPPSISGSLDSSLVKLEVPLGKIFKTIVSPTGGLVAFLSKTHVFCYATDILGTRGLWNKKLGDVVCFSALSGLKIHNGTNGKWKSMSLSNRYLLLRGQLGVILYELQPLDLAESVEVMITDAPNLSRLMEAEVSCQGHIAFRFTDHLKIWYQGTSGEDGHLHTLTVTGSLHAAAFSSDGSFLFAWACGSNPNFWYIWHIHTEPPVLARTGSYDPIRVGPPMEGLIPLADKAAFIIRETQGVFSIVQNFSNTSQPVYFPKQLSGIITCIYAPRQNALILVRPRHSWSGRRSWIEMLRLLPNSDGLINFATRSRLQKLGKSTYHIRKKDRCGIAVTGTGATGSLSLLISHPDGVLERLTI